MCCDDICKSRKGPLACEGCPIEEGVNKLAEYENAEEKSINLYFIGEGFYWESGTAMSSIYVEGTNERYDWGFVQVALAERKNVTIRPANAEEMKAAMDKLSSIRARREVEND